MTRKDIALTVGGILASMALAYLFYRQQAAAAGAAAASAAAAAVQNDPSDQAQQDLYDQYMTEQYASQFPSLSVPSISATSSTAAPEVDVSSSTAATGGQPATDVNDLLSQIIAAYLPQGSSSASSTFSPLVIPTLQSQPAITTAGIPTTATAALTSAQSMLSVNGGLTSTQNAAVPNPSVSPVHDNHIQASV